MKHVNMDTFRLSRSNVSILLTTLLFCLLLFMEEEEGEEKEEGAYEELCTDLGKLLDKLRDLQIDINKRKLIVTEISNNNIDSLIQMIISIRHCLEENVVNKRVKKNINIKLEMKHALDYLSRAFKWKHYSNEELNILVAQVEKICKQIQIKVEEAVQSANH